MSRTPDQALYGSLILHRGPYAHFRPAPVQSLARPRVCTGLLGTATPGEARLVWICRANEGKMLDAKCTWVNLFPSTLVHC